MTIFQGDTWSYLRNSGIGKHLFKYWLWVIHILKVRGLGITLMKNRVNFWAHLGLFLRNEGKDISYNSYVISYNNFLGIVNWEADLVLKVDSLIKLVKQTFVFFSLYSIISPMYKLLLLYTIYFDCYFSFPYKLILNFLIIYNIHNIFLYLSNIP